MTQTAAGPGSRKMLWIGWIIGAVPMAMLVMSGAMKFSGSKQVIEGFQHLGWDEKTAATLAIVELSCVVLYLIPRTCVLGAILVTGYLGGAAATHVRIGEPWFIPVGLGVAAWLGLFIRDARLRALLPLRKP